MTTYAIIDNASGYVWGVTAADSPIDACLTIDADIGTDPREYEQKARPDFANECGYHVYEAPAGFEVADGQSEDEIDRVAALPKVAYFKIVEAA
jgi:hypothetical protein